MKRWRRRPNFDEHDALPAFAMPVVHLLIGNWTWTIRRIRANRTLILLAIASGTALGLFLWPSLAGPALLG